MEVVGTVVHGQLVVHAVEGELSFGDAVGEASHGGAHGALLVVFLQGIVAQYHIHQLAAVIWHADGADGRAVVKDLGFAACIRGEGVERDGGAVGSGAKGTVFDLHGESLLCRFSSIISYRLKKKRQKPLGRVEKPVV